jgi:hypothetical protein
MGLSRLPRTRGENKEDFSIDGSLSLGGPGRGLSFSFSLRRRPD